MTPRSKDKKEDKIEVRIDERTRAAFEEVKEIYGFKSDADAMRGIIAILHNREKTIAEIEGRLRPYIQEQMWEYGRSEENKDLVRAVVDEVLKEEIGGSEE